jgi:hypothetical protein
MRYFEALIAYGAVKKGEIIPFSEEHVRRYRSGLRYAFRELDNCELLLWLGKKKRRGKRKRA